MKAIDMFKKPADVDNVPAAFVNGFTDGQAARVRNEALTAYLRVGIDDYAKGFRAGFYNRATPQTGQDRPARRHIAKL